jgi:hypothetical protein
MFYTDIYHIDFVKSITNIDSFKEYKIILFKQTSKAEIILYYSLLVSCIIEY